MASSAQRRTNALYLIGHPAELGRRLGYPDLRDDLHGAWMRSMLRYPAEDMTLQAHRGSYKTTCLCIVIALLMVRYREASIMFLRKTDADVTEVVRQVLRILQHPLFVQMVQALTGERLEVIKSTSTEITTSAYGAPRGSSQLLGIGLGGSLTGKHAEIIITDDIVNRLDRVSHAERERTKAVYMELQNVKNRGGRIINTGTPWHKEDAFSIMPEAQKYDCYQTGLIAAEKLEALRMAMSPSLFAANYELRHIAAENALFTSAPRFTDDAALLRDGIAHIDAAYGGEDYTALTCARRAGDTVYMYGRLWHSHVDVILPAALAECSRLLCGPISCETNGDKGYLAREIRRAGGSARPYPETMNKYVKISTYLRKWWGHIVFLQGTDPDYIAQILDYSEDAEHDDAPDSAASVCRLLDARAGNDGYASPFLQG